MSLKNTAQVLICGAGLAGISAAYALTVEQGVHDVVLVDERDPMSLTSDKSTECYRNWWQDGAMVALMNRSIDRMEALSRQYNNPFQMNRRGYLYVTADSKRTAEWERISVQTASLGGGPLRFHHGKPGEEEYLPSPAEGWESLPSGADLMTHPGFIRKYFPYLSEKTIAVLHVRRAGWLSAQQMGAFLLQQARARGARLVHGKVVAVEQAGGRVSVIKLDDGSQWSSQAFVNAAGPYAPAVGKLLGLELPIFSQLHQKAIFKDPLGVVPRSAPLLIWSDSQALHWKQDEEDLIREDPTMEWMLHPLPAGAHTRPEGGSGSQNILALWDYHVNPVEPTWPPSLDEQFPELVLRGLVAMLPGMEAYIHRAARPALDGGYYSQTPENRPLIGPLPVEGAFILAALSGFGVMAACAAGELLAACISSTSLPSFTDGYASAFRLERYADTHYRQAAAAVSSFGQL